jgi:DNA-binding MarR family transcriptional regulator
MATAPLIRLLALTFKRSRTLIQRDLEQHGLHAGQDYLLELLSDEPDGLTVGEMAARLGIEVPTAVRTAQRMEAAGLVEKRRDPTDRRRSLIVLTERGRELDPVAREALRRAERSVTRGLSAAERKQLLELLERVLANLPQRE